MTDEQESYEHDPPGHDGHEHDDDQQFDPEDRADDPGSEPPRSGEGPDGDGAARDEDADVQPDPAGRDDHGHDPDRPDGVAHDDDDHDMHHHHDLEAVGAAVLTVSSSRSLDDDPAGDAIAAAFEAGGHEVVQRELVGDDYDTVQTTVSRFVDRDDVDVVVSTGGTGVTPDDVTVEAVRHLFDKRLPGFGELFRALSREEIGTRVVATRTAGGVASGVPVFCLPGSENAARLGAEEIIVPEVPHLAGLAKREDEPLARD